MLNVALNETFTNGYLDFSEPEDDDISMACEIVNDFQRQDQVNKVDCKSLSGAPFIKQYPVQKIHKCHSNRGE